MRSIQLSVRSWQRILIFAGPIVVFVLLIWFVQHVATSAIKEQAIARDYDELKTMSKRLSKHFERAGLVAQAVAKYQEEAPEAVVPYDRMMDHLKFLLASQPEDELQGVYIAYEKGKLQDRKTNPWYARPPDNDKVVNYDFRDEKDPQCEWYVSARALGPSIPYTISEPYFDKDGADQYLISITTPVRSDQSKTPIGVAGADVKLDQLKDFLQELTLSSDAYTCLVSRGHPKDKAHQKATKPVVFAYDEGLAEIFGNIGEGEFPGVEKLPGHDKILASAEATFVELTDDSGQRRLVSWHTLEEPKSFADGEPRWKIMRNVSYESVYAPVHEVTQNCIYAGLIGLVPLIVISWVLGDILLSPMYKLSKAALAVESGDYQFDGLSTVAQRDDEFALVARGIQKISKAYSKAQSEIAERENFFTAVIQNSTDLITVLDQDLKVVYRSPSIHHIMGYEPDETMGENGRKLIHPDDLGRFMQMASRDRNNLPRTGLIEYRFLHKNGSWRSMEGSFNDMGEDSEFGRIILNSRDITDRKADEEQIHQLAADLKLEKEGLERRVVERTAELDEALKQKDQFLNNLTHDLRLPLSIILGLAEDLYGDAVEAGHTQYVSDLTIMLNRGRDLTELVDDLVNFSKVRNGKNLSYKITEFDLAGLVNERIESLTSLAKKYQNTIRLDAEPNLGKMTSDRTKVWRILMNLLSNAFEFTKKGKVTVSASRIAGDGLDQIILKVSDTGVGIDKEKQERLFQPFTQIEGASQTNRTGIGLGLSICKLYCESLGGKISLESELGKGTTFTVVLPAVSSSSPGNTPLPAPTRPKSENQTTGDSQRTPLPSASNLVLVIDDDKDSLLMTKRRLEQEGYRTSLASDGVQGLQLATQLQPSAIVLDIVMPGIDGWAVLAALKSNEKTSHIPIIMASMLDEGVRGLSMGADEFVTKPEIPLQLAKLLHKQLNRKEPGCILIVEDDLDMRSLLSRSLKEQGWDVIESDDGSAAMQIIRDRHPDLVLLDLKLPTMDGFDVVDEVRQDEGIKLTPILILTAKDLSPEDRERLQGRVDRVVQKGQYQRKELLSEIRTLVSESHMRDSSSRKSERTDG